MSVQEQAAACLDAAGHTELRRRRGGGVFHLRFDGVPPALLPSEVALEYGPEEPEMFELDVACQLWIYWIPLAADDPEDAEGLLCVAGLAEQLPEEAQPIRGLLRCPGATETSLSLDGSSMGPFTLKAATDAAGCQPRCLLAGLELELQPPEGFAYVPREPSPFLERCGEERGGCGLVGLVQSPVLLGNLKPLPLQPTSLMLRTSCCREALEGTRVTVDGQALPPVDAEGLVALPRRQRNGGTHPFDVKLSGLPFCMSPEGGPHLKVQCGFCEPEVLRIETPCRVWFYWLPPDLEEDEFADDEEPMPIEGLFYVAADAEQIPEEARPVAGVVKGVGRRVLTLTLDGASMGPFSLQGPAKSKDHSGAPVCVLAALQFHLAPPAGFEFLPKQPSPLAERCEELGGCELQRLAQCPVAVGKFRALQ